MEAGNCDKRHGVVTSSFQESLIPARGLWAYGQTHNHQPSLDAAQRAADLVLARRLLWRIGDGALITPRWGGRADRIHYPIQFYDVLFALQVMAESDGSLIHAAPMRSPSSVPSNSPTVDSRWRNPTLPPPTE